MINKYSPPKLANKLDKANFRTKLVNFARWLLDGERSKGAEEQYVDQYLDHVRNH